MTTTNKYNTDNPYQIERAKKAEVFQAQVKALAKALGGSYVKPKGELWEGADYYGEITLAVGGLHLHRDSQKNRIEVGGTWPRDNKGEQYTPRGYTTLPSGYKVITLSLDRPVEALAKGIQSRFLPAYLAEYALLVAQAERSNEYRRNTRATLDRVAQILKVAPPVDNPHNRESSRHIPFGNVLGGVDVSGEDIEIKIHNLSLAQAEQILAVVVGFPEKSE